MRRPLSLSRDLAREAKGENRPAIELFTEDAEGYALRMQEGDVQSLHGTHGDVLTAVSDGMVALLKEFYGRGPTQAKTYYYDDLVVCLLRGGFTRVEQTLLDGGRGHAVIEQRMAFQEVMRERFTAVIEHATGRSVVGFMSGNQQDPDMICEVFVLSPTDLIADHELPTAGGIRADR